MNKIKILLTILLFTSSLYASNWDKFFENSGFPRKVIDNGSLVTGKILDAKVSYQIKNNDGIKGNFENSDSAKVIITNSKGKTISTNEFLNVAELRSWGKDNFFDILAVLIGDKKFDKDTINEITNLALIALQNRNIE